MSNYIKTHSNYLLKSKHQLINDGTIYERDITTIGGINRYPFGQTPIYQSGNFLISVRNDGVKSNQYNEGKWKENASGTVWTLENISATTTSTDEDNDTKIVLKQDYYDFRDYAYYGSLTELFRASVSDAVARFPGEMYGTRNKAYYTKKLGTIDYEQYEERKEFDTGNTSFYVDNPFGINIYSEIAIERANPLKYFANEGYKNYEVIEGDNEHNYAITEWSVTKENDDSFCVGDKLAEVRIKTTIRTYTIDVYMGDGGEIVYLSSNMQNVHIRPKKRFLDEFFNECDNFQRLLLNKDTDYKATFSVIKENDYGYYREYETLQFPTREGGYNLDVTSYGFNDYTKKMVEIGEYYDEKFTDNLWRSMTHESIKNFDWTRNREYVEGDEEEYVLGGRRIQKALRIFAREFDEILPYINNIRNINRITYDERNNIPDYFLTDIVENAGWNVKLVYPYTLTEYSTEEGWINEIYEELPQLNNKGFGNASRPIRREFSQDPTKEYTPYSTSSNDGKYANNAKWSTQKCNNEFLRRLKINSPSIWKYKGSIDGIEMLLGMFGLRSKRWLNAKKSNDAADYEITEYTSFAKRIEDVWDAEHQDYRINWLNTTKTISYDNRSISVYDPNGFGTTMLPYQGLLASYKDSYEEGKCYIKVDSLENMINDGVTSTSSISECFKRADGTPVLRRFLYPSFNKDEELDGNPYFQMNGGWKAKTLIGSEGNKRYNFQLDVDDNIVYSNFNASSGDNEYEYSETVRNVKRVDNVTSLLSIPLSELYNGIICNVTTIEKDSAVIDGVVYPIVSEWNPNTKEVIKYISLIKDGGYIKVGNDTFFDSTICVYNSNSEPTLYTIEDKFDGYEIKAYIKEGYEFICQEKLCEDDDYPCDVYSISNFQILSNEEDDLTNYFLLDNLDYSSELADSEGNNGWRRLKTSDKEYLKLNTIINDNKGNNPHNGNMVYDNGHEYFTYYKRLFKYAIDNDLFDTRCYNDYYLTLDDEISHYGFKGLINDDESILRYEDFLLKDTKIHYFGNYKTKKENGTIDKVYIYGDSNNRLNGFKTIYSDETSDVRKYNLNGANLVNEYEAPINDYESISSVAQNNIARSNGTNNSGSNFGGDVSQHTEYNEHAGEFSNENSETANNSGSNFGGDVSQQVGESGEHIGEHENIAVSEGWIENTNPYQGKGGDEVTNQIINNKILKIKFNLHDKWYLKRGQEEVKYIDDIIMNYLTQMIPSTTILQIEYVSK